MQSPTSNIVQSETRKGNKMLYLVGFWLSVGIVGAMLFGVFN